MKQAYQKWFNIQNDAYDLVMAAEASLEEQFKEHDAIRAYNQGKIIKAFQDNRLHSTDFGWRTGYGYDDIGRDKTEAIYASVFKAEDALVRPSIASGTHALSLCLFGLLGHGDQMLSIAGPPYDTLLKVIGVNGGAPGNLMESGVHYDQIDLKDGAIDYDGLRSKLNESKVKVVWIQRSTGYSDRPALTIKQMDKAIQIVRSVSDAIIVVDNCYGEFVEKKEPLEIGADLIAGSLIKNPGGGLAVSGGYIAGKAELIERIANRLTAPGIGKDCGLTYGTTRTTLQGLFQAPAVVNNAVKGALLFAKLFSDMGYSVTPSVNEKRSDIIEAIALEDSEKVESFCRAIQGAAVVDADAIPFPSPMPGYIDEVIMASGSFIDGSSIELSADGPLRPPYWVYFQGGMVYDQIRIAAMRVMNEYI